MIYYIIYHDSDVFIHTVNSVMTDNTSNDKQLSIIFVQPSQFDFLYRHAFSIKCIPRIEEKTYFLPVLRFLDAAQGIVIGANMYRDIDSESGEAAVLTSSDAFAEENVRKGFIKKVYGILTFQLTITMV